MNKRVEKAFSDFNNGIRPEGYKTPRYWYVLNTIGNPYPAKAIWAMATDDKPGNFNTRDARIGLTNLEYSLVDTRVLTEPGVTDDEVEKSKADTAGATKSHPFPLLSTD